MVEKKTFEPLIIDLPTRGDEYFEILGEYQARSMRSGLVTLRPGQNVGSHNTEDYEEIIIILEGAGVLVNNGRDRLAITTGQVAFNPSRTEHDVINTGDSPMRYIYVVAKLR